MLEGLSLLNDGLLIPSQILDRTTVLWNFNYCILILAGISKMHDMASTHLSQPSFLGAGLKRHPRRGSFCAHYLGYVRSL